jgi:hypothetical protein
MDWAHTNAITARAEAAAAENVLRAALAAQTKPAGVGAALAATGTGVFFFIRFARCGWPLV